MADGSKWMMPKKRALAVAKRTLRQMRDQAIRI